MITISRLSLAELEEAESSQEVSLPIEQTSAWARYQETIQDRSFWGCLDVADEDGRVALVSMIEYKTHGYRYLRSAHGPVYVRGNAAEAEKEVIEAIVAFVKKCDKSIAFMRLAVDGDHDFAQPTLSTTPYDETVIMDITGSDEDIISRLKKRGRRDVRKALRESPATYADETDLATASFDEYYDVMVETASRDGFSAAPKADYENMIRILGPGHCRVFAGRIDGKVVTWTITTISGTHGVRYYGASRADVPNRNFVTDGLIYFEACTLSKEGIADYDMMGIGSERYPALMTLNTFKCKFAEGTVHVAPDHDVPVRKSFYKALQIAKGLRG